MIAKRAPTTLVNTTTIGKVSRYIVLFRHGKAEDRAASAEDAKRRLTRAGKNAVRLAARGLRARVPHVSLILTSPLPRALQTAELLAARFRPPRGLRQTDDLRPGGNKRRLAATLRALRLPVIAVVGHEPDLSDLARRLIGSDAGTRLHLSKSGACLLELDVAAPKGARLCWQLRRKELQQTP
jgi:phosphohistidine phosphatase